jgi:hypothetical protein
MLLFSWNSFINFSFFFSSKLLDLTTVWWEKENSLDCEIGLPQHVINVITIWVTDFVLCVRIFTGHHVRIEKKIIVTGSRYMTMEYFPSRTKIYMTMTTNDDVNNDDDNNAHPTWIIVRDGKYSIVIYLDPVTIIFFSILTWCPVNILTQRTKSVTQIVITFITCCGKPISQSRLFSFSHHTVVKSNSLLEKKKEKLIKLFHENSNMQFSYTIPSIKVNSLLF